MSNYQRVRVGDLRRIVVPPAAKGEPDHITALRRTLEFHANSPAKTRVAVPQAIWSLIPTETQATPAIPSPTQNAGPDDDSREEERGAE